VLGKTFTRAALAALSGLSEPELEPLLSSLVRKEVLGVQSDPRSPERGQHGFLQDLVRQVAHDTLSKRERKTRHLAAAEHLSRAFPDEDELAEVLASHYLAAFEAAPDADDAQAIRERAREMLARAGARAGSLGAPGEGARYFEQASDLTDEPLLQAELLEHAGRLTIHANRPAEARKRLERALTLHEQAGDTQRAARVSARLADVDMDEGRIDEGAVRLERAVAGLEQAEPSPELAAAFAQLGRMLALAGHGEDAVPPLEQALALAERLGLPEVFVEALTSKAIPLMNEGRLAEARILLEAAGERAHAEELYASALRAENNLGVVLEASDRYPELLELLGRAIALARRRGDRRWESQFRTASMRLLILLGRWDEALAIAAEQEPSVVIETARSNMLYTALIHCERGRLDVARGILAAGDELRDSDHPQVRASYAGIEARLLRAEGRYADAVAAALRGIPTGDEPLIKDTFFRRALVEAIEAALAQPDLDRAEELLAIPESLEPGEMTPFLRANAARLRARLDAARGEDERIEESFRLAARLFNELGCSFHLAVTHLEHGEWLAGRGDAEEAEPLLVEARETFEQLKATPWLERMGRLTLPQPEREPLGELA
jgi:tetratricopeptide (TPR) repeat protein